MNTVLWILFVIYLAVLVLLVVTHFMDKLNRRNISRETVVQMIIFLAWPVVLAGVIVWALLCSVFEDQTKYLQAVWHHGGFRKYREYLDNEKKKQAEEAARIAAEEAEYNRIKQDFLDGKTSRTELPRATDGEWQFEFDPQLCLSVNSLSEVLELVYVERRRSEVLNSFFERHRGFQLYHMYRFVYLPHFCEQLSEGELLSYFYPFLDPKEYDFERLESSYPLKYLAYPDDAEKIEQGMFLFCEGMENHGAKYTCGSYYPLHEGTDEEIVAQLHEIVSKAHGHHGVGSVYCKMKKPQTEEGSTRDYADELFLWTTHDEEVAILVEEIRERVKELRRRGMGENLLKKIIHEKPRASRLLITKDYRIVLPDYQNMEIKMEPLVKAVYLLFLRHKEGIVFKHLPDYRKELMEIYLMLKPSGLTDQVRKSIEDVTDPRLNSINEKCARIRGAFISKFDVTMASCYYIDGRRGEPKSIMIDRRLVEWEE